MKTIDLYLKILNDVRYEVLTDCGELTDYPRDSQAYKTLHKVHKACNLLSDLISVMEYEIKG